MFSYFQQYFIFFSANEPLAVPFVKFARGRSRVGHLRFFCLHRITFRSIPAVTQSLLFLEIFPVTCILPSGCLCGWLNSNVSFSHLTIRTVWRGSYVILRRWKVEPRIPELLEDLNWKNFTVKSPFNRETFMHALICIFSRINR